MRKFLLPVAVLAAVSVGIFARDGIAFTGNQALVDLAALRERIMNSKVQQAV